MKKLLFSFIFLGIISAPTMAVELSECDINEKLATIGFGKFFAFDPQEQIKNLFKDYEKAGNKHKINQVKTFYHSNYVNADGFSYNSYFDLVGQTWDLYPDLQYSFEVKSIDVNGDYATVQIKETARGIAKEPSEYLADKGELESEAEFIYYLKKYGNQWKIISDSAIYEKTFIKYGDAKNIAFDIAAPGMTAAGEEYCVTFAADVPKDRILLGSITNEKITFPTERPKEVFRKLQENGMLERILKANNEGYNEQAVVSVGITKTEIGKDKNLKLSVSGVAFLMTRVNVTQIKHKNLGEKFNVEKEQTEL